MVLVLINLRNNAGKLFVQNAFFRSADDILWFFALVAWKLNAAFYRLICFYCTTMSKW